MLGRLGFVFSFCDDSVLTTLVKNQRKWSFKKTLEKQEINFKLVQGGFQFEKFVGKKMRLISNFFELYYQVLSFLPTSASLVGKGKMGWG